MPRIPVITCLFSNSTTFFFVVLNSGTRARGKLLENVFGILKNGVITSRECCRV